MAKHVIARAADFPDGARRLVQAAGRSIAVFNVGGDYFGIANACPHQGGSLAEGARTGLPFSDKPGEFGYVRDGEFVRCPWHGWEFDLRTGQSWCDPTRFRVRAFDLAVEPGAAVARGPYVAETFPVSVEDDYVVLTI